MRTLYTLTLLSLWLLPGALNAQVFKIYDNFSQLEERIAQAQGSTLLVINFWATYCKPCREELPYFNALHEKYANSDFRVILVSLDFKSELEKKFIPFLRDAALRPEIILLADRYQDEWIPRLKPDWPGTLPLTMLVLGNNRAFREEEFQNFGELEQFVKDFCEKVGQPLSEGSN